VTPERDGAAWTTSFSPGRRSRIAADDIRRRRRDG
jgi:hypothetical protein